jgi:hypothetical protein
MTEATYRTFREGGGGGGRNEQQRNAAEIEGVECNLTKEGKTVRPVWWG